MTRPINATAPEPVTVLLSALEHYSYCPRQCALIHVEQIFDENVFTLRGRSAHERVHAADESGTAAGVRVERGLPLSNEALGLYGVADVVEFHPDGTVYPVEHKSGPRRNRRHDDIQLCGQALCLEAMLGVSIPRGAVYSIASKRRREVALDEALRSETLATVEAVRALLVEGSEAALPPPADDARCPNCSLNDACVPETLALAQALTGQWETALFQVGPEDEAEETAKAAPQRSALVGRRSTK